MFLYLFFCIFFVVCLLRYLGRIVLRFFGKRKKNYIKYLLKFSINEFKFYIYLLYKNVKCFFL